MHAWINMTRPGFSCRQEMPDDGDQWIPWATMVEQVRAKGAAEGRAALLARDVIELRSEVVDLRVQVADLGAIAERLAPVDFLLQDDPEHTTLERMASVIQEQRKKLGRMEGAQIVSEQDCIATRKQLREARKELRELKDVLAQLREDFNEWAVSRATGSLEIEDAAASKLWKTWCLTKIPTNTNPSGQ